MVALDKLSIDKLHGILTAYEMRTNTESSKRETAFKASKKGKQKEQSSCDSSGDDSDSKEPFIMRKLRKNKKKMPLKCFNCGKAGYFVAKCPYENNENTSYKKKPKFNKKKYKRKDKMTWKSKKSLY